LHGESSSPHAYINGNEFTWWTTPRAYIYIDPLPDAPAIDLMVGDLDSEFAAERGAWPLRGSIVGNSAVWVFPGALRDELDAQGLVLHPRESDG
jgi:hypothetical protein